MLNADLDMEFCVTVAFDNLALNLATELTTFLNFLPVRVIIFR